MIGVMMGKARKGKERKGKGRGNADDRMEPHASAAIANVMHEICICLDDHLQLNQMLKRCVSGDRERR